VLQSRTSEGTEAQSKVGKHEKAHESQKMGKQDIKRHQGQSWRIAEKGRPTLFPEASEPSHG
jgi:hypothetical protein